MTLDYDALLRSESDRFLEVLHAVDPAAPVPTCPEWNASDLLWHLAEVQHFFTAIITGASTDPMSHEPPDRPTDHAALRALFAEVSQSLSDALTTRADTDPAWSWFEPDQTVGFTRRRQTHEALIHRVDAERTAGIEPALDSELAADGVDEVLTIMLGSVPGWAELTPEGPTGRIRCTGPDREWVTQVQGFRGTSPNTGTVYTHEPVLVPVAGGETTFAIEGPAVELDLWLWNRGGSDRIVTTGDTAAFDAIVAAGLE